MSYKPPTKLELRVILEDYLASPEARTMRALIPDKCHFVLDLFFYAGMQAGQKLTFQKMHEVLAAIEARKAKGKP